MNERMRRLTRLADLFGDMRSLAESDAARTVRRIDELTQERTAIAAALAGLPDLYDLGQGAALRRLARIAAQIAELECEAAKHRAAAVACHMRCERMRGNLNATRRDQARHDQRRELEEYCGRAARRPPASLRQAEWGYAGGGDQEKRRWPLRFRPI
jgi:hypothetical protein